MSILIWSIGIDEQLGARWQQLKATAALVPQEPDVAGSRALEGLIDAQQSPLRFDDLLAKCPVVNPHLHGLDLLYGTDKYDRGSTKAIPHVLSKITLFGYANAKTPNCGQRGTEQKQT